MYVQFFCEDATRVTVTEPVASYKWPLALSFRDQEEVIIYLTPATAQQLHLLFTRPEHAPKEQESATA